MERSSSGFSKEGGILTRRWFKYEGVWRSEHEEADERASDMEPKVNSKIHRPITVCGLFLGRPLLGAKTWIPTHADLSLHVRTVGWRAGGGAQCSHHMHQKRRQHKPPKAEAGHA